MPRNFIISFLDKFYPPFRRYMPIQTFRYLACGGGNTLLDIIIYTVMVDYIIQPAVVEFGFIAISRYILAFMIAFAISFPTGFWLMRSIVFTNSDLRGRVQLFRYFLLVAVCILLNYAFLKLFVETWNVHPVPAKIFTTVIVISFSYLTQKHFTFKVKKGVESLD